LQQCKQLGHWAADCPQKQQHAGDRGGKSAAKKKAGAFLVHAMGASRANIVEACSWYCDRGATGHFTPNKQYFVSNTKFTNPETIVFGKKMCCCKHTLTYDTRPVLSQRGCGMAQ